MQCAGGTGSTELHTARSRAAADGARKLRARGKLRVMTSIVMLRQFDRSNTPEDMHAAVAGGKWCLDLYRVVPRIHFLAVDGTRCACVFEAPDADAMRHVLRSTGLEPPLALWPATVHAGPDDDAAGNGLPKTSGVLAVVERTFPQPVTFAEIESQEEHNIACLNLHRVRFVRSYFSFDRLNMICLYQAPDAEAVRTSNRQVGLPFERVWSAQVVASRLS
jgi:hypothetical protein